MGDDVDPVALLGCEAVQNCLGVVRVERDRDVLVVLAHEEQLAGIPRTPQPEVRTVDVEVEQLDTYARPRPVAELGVRQDIAAPLAPDAAALTVLDDRDLANTVIDQVVLELADDVAADHDDSSEVVRTGVNPHASSEAPDHGTRDGVDGGQIRIIVPTLPVRTSSTWVSPLGY